MYFMAKSTAFDFMTKLNCPSIIVRRYFLIENRKYTNVVDPDHFTFSA